MVTVSTAPSTWTWTGARLEGASLVVVFHERIAVVGRGSVGLLDHARADPADQVEERPRLVIGAGGAGTAERLQTDHGACRFVVDVEVARRVDQLLGCLRDGSPVARKDGARQAVRAGAVAQVQG